MKVSKIKIENFRLLKNFTIDLEEELSLVIGKNNCGKTSFLLALDKFLNNKTFSFNDFNNNFKEELKEMLNFEEEQMPVDYSFVGIKLKLFIEYEGNDDLSNIGDKVIMDLDPNNNVVVIGFEYHLPEKNFYKFKSDFIDSIKGKESKKENEQDIFTYMERNFKRYFVNEKKSIYYDIEKKQEDEQVFTDLLKEKVNIDNIINFKWINARRNVSNKDNERSLSTQSSRIYRNMEEENNDELIIEEFKDTLLDTDNKLNKIYHRMFDEVINDVRDFGGITEKESEIKITSTLQHKELLDDNTTVVYGAGGEGIELSESHNGLGYMNLISMIFEIKIIINEFLRNKDSKVSDINLLFIEEPEAHTHPQMQRIFIRNIKTILSKGIPIKDQSNRKLQTILSTHSPHIVADSDFLDIKYFKKVEQQIKSKNLKDLEKEYEGKESYYKFLKQYLTIHRADLFFADKAVFIEGDTESIILPAMMRKVDVEDEIKEVETDIPLSIPLLSQNVSIVEVGSYSQVFEKFIDFVGVKSLIITDIDSIKEEIKKDEDGVVLINRNGTEKKEDVACRVEEGFETSNASLKHFFSHSKFNDLIDKTMKEKTLKKDSESKEWVVDESGNTLISYQVKEGNSEKFSYCGRSFEDSFLHINKEFISQLMHDSEGGFIGNTLVPNLQIGRLKEFSKGDIDSFEMARGVEKKPAFAMEVLLNSEISEKEYIHHSEGTKVKIQDEFSNWNIPLYIKEGLQWLKKD